MITCPSCGRNNEPHYKFCLGCGTELPSPSAMPTPTTRGWLDDEPAVPEHTKVEDLPSITPGPANETLTIEGELLETRPCPSCGTLVTSSFTFCGQCGARMDVPVSTIRNLPQGTVTQGALVLVRADGTEGGTHELAMGDNAIGRGRGPLFDGDGYLSPKHATLTLSGDGAQIADMGSLNGVFVRLVEEEEIYDGDVFRIGQELLRFDLLPPAEPLPDGTHIMGSPPGGAWGRLVLIVSREQDGSAFPVGGESAILGRERGDILFPEDGYVSGTHARVSTRNGRHYLADLNSSNGTFLKLRGARAVASGSLVLMGQQLFRVNY